VNISRDYYNLPLYYEYMRIVSTAFNDGSMIPERYTCVGENVNPPFEFYDLPMGTESLALIMDDLDTPYEVAHWLFWDFDPSILDYIRDNLVPSYVVEGKNNFGGNHYTGPCPPEGEIHRYRFRIYAVNTKSIGLSADSEKHHLEEVMQQYLLAEASVTGQFGR